MERCATVFVWGANEYGALGLGGREDLWDATAVEALSGGKLVVTHAAAGARHLVLVTSEDEVYVAGDNSQGQLGFAESELEDVPVCLEEACSKGIKQVACGRSHTLALCASPEGKTTLLAWGSAARGQTGPNPETASAPCTVRRVPLDRIAARARVRSVACGENLCLGLLAESQAFSWGANDRGQLGLGHVEDVAEPTLVKGLSGVQHVACGAAHSAFLTQPVDRNNSSAAQSNLLLCGDNTFGQLGLGLEAIGQAATCAAPLTLHDANVSVHAVFLGARHTIIQAVRHLTSPSGQQGDEPPQFFGFGCNSSGELGMASPIVVAVPNLITSLVGASVSDIALGDGCTFVWVDSWQCSEKLPGLYACGKREGGRLGLGPGADVAAGSLARVPSIPATPPGRVACSSFAVVFPRPVGELAEMPNTLSQLCSAPRATQQGIRHQSGLETPPPPCSSSRGASSEMAAAAGKPDNLPALILPSKTNEESRGLDAALSDVAADLLAMLHDQTLCDIAIRASCTTDEDPLGGSTGSRMGMPVGSGRESAKRAGKARKSQVAPDLPRSSTFPLHSAILSCRCPRLWKAVQERARPLAPFTSWRWTDAPANRREDATATLDGATADSLGCLVKFLYSDDAKLLDEYSAVQLLDVAWVAAAFCLDRLLALCQERVQLALNCENVITILARASELDLGAIKRECLVYISSHYETCVARRNRLAVGILEGRPDLLAEVIGLSSQDFARTAVASLPAPLKVGPSTFIEDMLRLLKGSALVDFLLELNPSASKVSPRSTLPHAAQGTPRSAVGPIACHGVVLAARCPAIRSALESLCESGSSPGSSAAPEVSSPASARSRDSRAVPRPQMAPERAARGVSLVDPSESSAEALQAFVTYLYSGSTCSILADCACDLLMLSHCYGLHDSCKLVTFSKSLVVSGLSPETAVAAACVGHLLGLADLESAAVSHVAENAASCLSDEALVRDAFEDFPGLAVKVLAKCGARWQVSSVDLRAAQDA